MTAWKGGMEDEELVRFFAYGKSTDVLPGGSLALRRAIERLVHLGVITRPLSTDLIVDVVERARVDCRARLERRWDTFTRVEVAALLDALEIVERDYPNHPTSSQMYPLREDLRRVWREVYPKETKA